MPPAKAGSNSSYGSQHKLSAARAAEFSLVDTYKLGYRNREDITNLPPGVLIKGSQNVLVNIGERVQIRQGYTLDGATSTVLAPILSSFDWLTRGNQEVHMRAGFLTSAGNDGKLQFRYVDPNGNVTWTDLMTGLTSTAMNFTTFWDATETLREVIFVNNSPALYQWNGATAVLSATTSSSITKTGTQTFEDSLFYATTSPRSVTINGNTYTYTGGETTTTLTGVSPSPAAEPANSLIIQTVITIPNSTLTGTCAPPSDFQNDLISVLNNQLFLGSLTSPAYFISNANPSTNSSGSILNWDQSSPRQPAEGATGILDQNIVAFVVQGTQTKAAMYVSAGTDLWYSEVLTDSTDQSGIPYEDLSFSPIKVGPQQGALSQAMVGNMKNYIMIATNETTIDLLGVIENFFTQTQTANISDPIKLDIDSYDFTDGSIFYYRYYIYVAVPKEGLILSYNLTTKAWDAPATIPVSNFYIVDGELYGHSYTTSESYQLFTGYADRVYPGFLGYPIPATMAFSYEQYGSRHTLKKANALYIEGYISANTVLTSQITYELDGCATIKTFMLDGSNKTYVCIPSEEGSLGKTSLGKQKLGGNGITSIQNLPPKFRIEFTFNNTNFFESSISFSINGTSQNFQLLAFGTNASQASEEAVYIRN